MIHRIKKFFSLDLIYRTFIRPSERLKKNLITITSIIEKLDELSGLLANFGDARKKGERLK